jgi:hypothetical protein
MVEFCAIVDLKTFSKYYGRFGVVEGILAYYRRGRGFDSRAVLICVHEHVCLYWVWVFLCIICMHLQKKNLCKYVFIRYLESITQA